jgi:hypothetical protein
MEKSLLWNQNNKSLRKLFKKDIENDCKREKVEQAETGNKFVYVDIAIFTRS